MKFIFSLVLALVIVPLIVSRISDGRLSDGAAVASRVEGTVLIFTPDAPAGRPIRLNENIAKNDRVEARGDSRLELRLPDGGCLRLTENARFTVQKLQFEKKTGVMNVQGVLHNGKVWVKITSSEAWAEVITSAALAVGRAAVFGLDAEEDAGATLNVYEGVVLAESAEGNAPRTIDQTSASVEARQVSIKAMQRISFRSMEGAAEPRDFDLKAAINDWVRWNLQRDAREGIASITITPVSPRIARGGFLQLAAVAHYSDGVARDITSFATWSSSDVNMVKIDPSGLAAGMELGEAAIAAVIEDMSGTTALTVSRDLVSINVTPASKSVMNGTAQQFRAIGTFSDNTVKDITSSVVWRSSNADVAFVDAAGRSIAGNVAGTAVISASLEALRGTATLNVRRELVSIKIIPESANIRPGELLRFAAMGIYSDKTTQDITGNVEWKSSNMKIVVMEQVQPGRVIGQNAGSATITATFKKISGSRTITVTEK